jgi:hypothetical protein
MGATAVADYGIFQEEMNLHTPLSLSFPLLLATTTTTCTKAAAATKINYRSAQRNIKLNIFECNRELHSN